VRPGAPIAWRGVDLAAMSGDTFEHLIAQNLHADAPTDLWHILLAPRLVDRTIAALRALRRHAVSQLAQRTAGSTAGTTAAARAGDRWHPRVLAFLGHIDSRSALVQATTGRPVHTDTVVDPADDTSIAAGLATLTRAIAAHRSATEAEVNPEGPDLTLWALIDGATVVHADGRRQTLAAWAAEWSVQPGAAAAAS
jgi:hypothetical protein